MFRLASAGVAVALFAWVLSQVDGATFATYAARLGVGDVLAFALGYACLNAFRTARYRALLAHPVPYDVTFAISWFHNAMVRFLPFKLGEATYLVQMHRRLGVPMAQAVSSLFGARLLELLVIILLALLAVLVASDALPAQSPVIGLALGVLVVLGGVSLYYASNIVGALSRLVARWDWLAPRLARLALALAHLRQPRPFVLALAYSFGTYLGSFVPNALLLQALGVPIEGVTLVLLVSLGMFATAFPFSLSGFGMVEASWAGGLMLLAGYAPHQAASVGLMLNLAQQLTALFFGVLGWLYLTRYQQAT
jgi:uncharacterized membrane protein YbhN (UPF0104 family)